MSFADALTQIFEATGDVRVSHARLGKGDAARTLYVPPDKAEVPGGSLVYIHTDDGDAVDLASRPTEDSTALNPRGLLEYGAPVIVAERKRARYRVIVDYDPDALPGFVAASGSRSIGAPLHGHGIFSSNPAWLDSRQIVNMSVQPKAGFGLTVQLIATANRTVYLDADGAPGVLANNIDIDLTASVPATVGAARWVTISLDTTAAAAIVTDGPEFTPLPSTLPVIRDVLADNFVAPSAGLGVGVVYLGYGQTGVGHEHIRSIERGTSGGAGGISSEANYAAINLVKNLPSFVNGSGVAINWWDVAGAAIVTEVKAQNEGIPRKYDRIIKVVASAAAPGADYLYQQYDPLYEELLDPSVTAVSLGVFVYVVGAGAVAVTLNDTISGVLDGQFTTEVGAWEYITLPNVTIGANDLELRFASNTPDMVFYVANPMLNVGPRALSWRPRGTRFVETMALLSTFTPVDTNFLTINVTTETHPLAVSINAMVELSTSAATADFEVKRLGIVQAFNANAIKMARAHTGFSAIGSNAIVLMDDGQNLEVRVTATGTAYDLYCRGFTRWE